MFTKRIALTTAAIAAALMLGLAGCASDQNSGASDGSKGSDGSTTKPVEPSTDPTGAWINNGRGIALVSWGSSSTACTPAATDITADGQKITVKLAEPRADAMCTRDFVPRASYIEVPEGVDVAEDVKVSFSGAELDGEFTLAGSSEVAKAREEAGDSLGGDASAGWFAPNGIVLLTWGSSSCPPIVSDIVERAEGATVEFKTDDSLICTLDLAPRLTMIGLADPVENQQGYTLTLQGGNLDGKVAVL